MYIHNTHIVYSLHKNKNFQGNTKEDTIKILQFWLLLYAFIVWLKNTETFIKISSFVSHSRNTICFGRFGTILSEKSFQLLQT